MTGTALLAGLLIAVLTLIGVIHAYWGFGGLWPGDSEGSLTSIVIGRTPGNRIPGLGACLFVTACLFAVAAFVAWRAGWFPQLGLPAWLWTAGYFGATFVFAARGIAGFVPALARYAEGTPFHRLNLIFYSPLCLAIAAGLIALWAMTRRA